MNANDFRYGDVVTYCHKSPFSFDKDLDETPVVCRVVAKLTTHSAQLKFNSSKDTYAIVPVEGEFVPDDLYFLRELGAQAEFEWGEVKDPSEALGAFFDEFTFTFDDEMREMFVEEGLCPRCGHEGEWRALALICPWHGMFV